jgi:hypothetical protein
MRSSIIEREHLPKAAPAADEDLYGIPYADLTTAIHRVRTIRAWPRDAETAKKHQQTGSRLLRGLHRRL